MTYRGKKLWSDPLDLVIGHLEHLEAALFVLLLLDTKTTVRTLKYEFF